MRLGIIVIVLLLLPTWSWAQYLSASPTVSGSISGTSQVTLLEAGDPVFSEADPSFAHSLNAHVSLLPFHRWRNAALTISLGQGLIDERDVFTGQASLRLSSLRRDGNIGIEFGMWRDLQNVKVRPSSVPCSTSWSHLAQLRALEQQGWFGRVLVNYPQWLTSDASYRSGSDGLEDINASVSINVEAFHTQLGSRRSTVRSVLPTFFPESDACQPDLTGRLLDAFKATKGNEVLQLVGNIGGRPLPNLLLYGGYVYEAYRVEGFEERYAGGRGGFHWHMTRHWLLTLYAERLKNQAPFRVFHTLWWDDYTKEVRIFEYPFEIPPIWRSQMSLAFRW